MRTRKGNAMYAVSNTRYRAYINNNFFKLQHFGDSVSECKLVCASYSNGATRLCITTRKRIKTRKPLNKIIKYGKGFFVIISV